MSTSGSAKDYVKDQDIMDQHTTEKLTDILKKTNNTETLQQYMDRLDEDPIPDSFQAYFCSLEKTKALGKAELIRRTNMDRSYGYQLLKGTRSPGRDKILLFSIAAGLDLHETQRALKSGGEAILYSRKKRDAIILFSLNEGLNIADTQELLEHFGEPLLENIKNQI